MILMREMTDICSSRGTVMIWRREPSMRMRIRISSPTGSRWMSLAFSVQARSMMEFTRRMVGAASSSVSPVPAFHRPSTGAAEAP